MNIEREIMFKAGQKALRITETPKAMEKKSSTGVDGFAQYAMSSVEKADRKVWSNEKVKPKLDNPENTLPEWARSTIGEGMNENNDDETFTYCAKKETDVFSKLKETVSDNESEGEEDKNSEEPTSARLHTGLNKDQSEYNNSDEDNEAFNFDASRTRKVSIATSNYWGRNSRIGNIMRTSQYERVQKRKTVSSELQSPGVLNSMVKQCSGQSDEKPKVTINDAKESEKYHRVKQKSITSGIIWFIDICR